MGIKNNYVKFRDHFFLFKLAHRQYEKKCQKQYNGPQDITILASNCIAGEVYHDLALPFNSPTINLWMVQPDFLKFASNIKYYVEAKLRFSAELKEKYQCSVAHLGEGFNEITVIFLHYPNDRIAEECWERRKKRINYDRICLMMSDRDGISYNDIIKFGKIDSFRKVLFTYKEYPEFEFTCQLEKDSSGPYVRNFQMKKWLLEMGESI